VLPPKIGDGGTSGVGANGTAVGLGARFLAFAFLARLGFVIPFFLRATAARFAFLDFFVFAFALRFFATTRLPIG